MKRRLFVCFLALTMLLSLTACGAASKTAASSANSRPADTVSATEGEGYFDVTHSNIPFIVKNKSMDVRVLGTTFNMTAYPEDLMVTTTLLTGKVAVTCHSQTDSTTQTTILTPGLQARFQPHEGVLQVDSVDVEEQTAWRRGEFAFEDVKLGNIMTIIGRSFALNVTFDTPELQDIKCFISIQRDKGYEEILKIIHIATGVNFKKDGNNIRVYK